MNLLCSPTFHGFSYLWICTLWRFTFPFKWKVTINENGVIENCSSSPFSTTNMQNQSLFYHHREPTVIENGLSLRRLLEIRQTVVCGITSSLDAQWTDFCRSYKTVELLQHFYSKFLVDLMIFLHKQSVS